MFFLSLTIKIYDQCQWPVHITGPHFGPNCTMMIRVIVIRIYIIVYAKKMRYDFQEKRISNNTFCRTAHHDKMLNVELYLNLPLAYQSL